MKLLLPFLFVPFICCYQASAQQFTDPNNEWHIDVWFPAAIDNYVVRPRGDTTINSVTYRTFYQLDERSPDEFKREVLMRETADGKVFQYYDNDDREQLIYDFGAALGDTLFQEEVCRLVVASVDSIQLNTGEYRKRIGLGLIFEDEERDSLVADYYWIAGMGNVGLDPLVSVANDCIAGPIARLGCYFYTNEFAYPTTADDCFLTSIDNQQSSIGVQIYPNPVGDFIFIKKMDQSVEVTSVTGQSATGQVVLLDKHTTPPRISVAHLPSGIYFVNVKAKDGRRAVSRIFKK